MNQPINRSIHDMCRVSRCLLLDKQTSQVVGSSSSSRLCARNFALPEGSFDSESLPASCVLAVASGVPCRRHFVESRHA